MRKKIHVAVVFNEPTVDTPEGRKYITESGELEVRSTHKEVVGQTEGSVIDMSEVGVLEEPNSPVQFLDLSSGTGE